MAQDEDHKMRLWCEWCEEKVPLCKFGITSSGNFTELCYEHECARREMSPADPIECDCEHCCGDDVPPGDS